MPVVNVHHAKTQLSRLLVQVEAGEEVVIARRGEPVARLVRCKPRGKRQFGAMKGKLVIDDSFFDPLPEEELRAWEGEPKAREREEGK
jgi:prevent-host-death family protein